MDMSGRGGYGLGFFCLFGFFLTSKEREHQGILQCLYWNFETAAVSTKIVRLKFVTDTWCWPGNGEENPCWGPGLMVEADDEQEWSGSLEQWGAMSFGQGRFWRVNSITATAGIASGSLKDRAPHSPASWSWTACRAVLLQCSPAVTRCAYWKIAFEFYRFIFLT